MNFARKIHTYIYRIELVVLRNRIAVRNLNRDHLSPTTHRQHTPHFIRDTRMNPYQRVARSSMIWYWTTKHFFSFLITYKLRPYMQIYSCTSVVYFTATKMNSAVMKFETTSVKNAVKAGTIRYTGHHCIIPSKAAQRSHPLQLIIPFKRFTFVFFLICLGL